MIGLRERTERTLRLSVALVCAALLFAAPAIAVQIETDGEGGYRVEAKRYAAHVGGGGSLVSLVCDGVEFLGEVPKHKLRGATFPGPQRAKSVNRHGNTVAARRGDVRVEYTLDDDGIDVLHEGAVVVLGMSSNVTALVRRDGTAKAGPLRKLATTGVVKVIAGDAAIGFSEPFHVNMRMHRAVPSRFPKGEKHETLTRYRIETALSADVGNVVANFKVTPVGFNKFTLPSWERGETPTFTWGARSLGGEPMNVRLVLRVDGKLDPVKGVLAGVMRRDLDAVLEADSPHEADFTLTPPESGPYWIRAELQADGETLTRQTVPFLYDPDGFKPPLTRPDDFESFWNSRLEALRSRPLEAKLSPRDAAGFEGAEAYDMSFVDASGRRTEGVLIKTAGDGPYRATIKGYLQHHDVDGVVRRFARSAANSDRPTLIVASAKPRNATYRHWNGRDDNNMLENYERGLRLLAYLQQREDVESIVLSGASRGGPMMIALAALMPEKVHGVRAHVPTSCGISWDRRRYVGWGTPPKDQLDAAAYFDPVNFAPDLVSPLLITGGIRDDLAPPTGLIALANHAENAPWVRLEITLAGHSGFPPNVMRELLEAFRKQSGQMVDTTAEERILREH